MDHDEQIATAACAALIQAARILVAKREKAMIDFSYAIEVDRDERGNQAGHVAAISVDVAFDQVNELVAVAGGLGFVKPGDVIAVRILDPTDNRLVERRLRAVHVIDGSYSLLPICGRCGGYHFCRDCHFESIADPATSFSVSSFPARRV